MLPLRWTDRKMSFERSTLALVRGYATALLSVGVAVIGLCLMESRWQASAPFALFILAVVFSAWVGGLKSGLLATALSALSFAHFRPHPAAPFAEPPIQMLRLLSFVVTACYIVWVTATERNTVNSLRRMHGELQRNNEALRAVLATLPVGVAVTDRSGGIILANEASNRIWGGRLAASGPERWAESKGYWHDTGEKIAATEWASVRALSRGEVSLNELIDIETLAGQRKTIQNSAAPICDAGGSIVGAVIVNEDVTERVRAEKALHDSTNRLQLLSRRLLAVQEEERRHLSRELHDEFGQLLATITLHLHAVRSASCAGAEANLDEVVTLLQHAGEQVRSLALKLRPTMLETSGLNATLRWLAEQHRRRADIAIQIVGHLQDVPAELAIACFRVAQEALTNVIRHARAHHVWIELSQGDQHVGLVVSDDGLGFDVTSALEQAGIGGNLGLLGMKERVEILGGKLEIDSRRGHGTRIRVTLPLPRVGAELSRHTA
jgi:signal transduction histidine kinase